MPPVDYDKLAKQHGGAPVDYDALAAEVAAVDAPDTAQDAPAASWGDTAKSVARGAVDVGIGAAKGLGNTAYGLGKLVHDYTPIGRISDVIQPGAFEEAAKPPELEPSNTAQRVGQGLEQVGEFFLPVGMAGKAGKVAEVAKAGALTLAQGGSPTASGVSAGLTAAVPGVSAARRAAGAIERSAQKEVAQALGATKEWAKSEAAQLAPEMIARGVKGSREAMLSQAKGRVAAVGKQLDDAYRTAAQAGKVIDGNVVAGNVQLVRDSLMHQIGPGRRVVIPGTEGVVKRLDDLADFVVSIGPDIPVDKAAHIKRTLDQIVSKAGLYGPKAGANSTDAATAWATREAAGAFRQLLNRDPTIAALNQEAAFWTGLKGVLKETQKRTQAQAGTGLVQAGTGGAGAVIGAMSGDSTSDRVVKGAIGGLAGRQLTKLVQSPGFRTSVSAPLKQALADALASGSSERVVSTVRRVTAAMPAQLRPSLAHQ